MSLIPHQQCRYLLDKSNLVLLPKITATLKMWNATQIHHLQQCNRTENLKVVLEKMIFKDTNTMHMNKQKKEARLAEKEK